MSTFTTPQAVSTFSTDVTAWSEPARSEVSVKGFPGGDAVAVSLGGQRELTRTVTVVLGTVAAYRTFASQRGKLGTLNIGNWDDAAGVSAVLKEVAPQPPYPDGVVFAVAQFLLL